MATTTRTGRPTLIDQAGPSRAPAAVLHPDDPLPKTWRVVSEWSYRGQRGAWLERTNTGGSWYYGRPETPTLVQVVYRATAKHSPRTSTTGSGLKYASRALVCSAWDLHWANVPNKVDYHAPEGSEAQGEADKAARAEHLGLTPAEVHARDKEAVERYGAKLHAESLKTDPLGLKHEDSKLIGGWADWALRRAREQGGSVERAMELFDEELSDGAKPWGQTIRPMVESRVRAALADSPLRKDPPAAPSKDELADTSADLPDTTDGEDAAESLSERLAERLWGPRDGITKAQRKAGKARMDELAQRVAFHRIVRSIRWPQWGEAPETREAVRRLSSLEALERHMRAVEARHATEAGFRRLAAEDALTVRRMIAAEALAELRGTQ